jgi:hypothetical protein
MAPVQLGCESESESEAAPYFPEAPVDDYGTEVGGEGAEGSEEVAEGAEGTEADAEGTEAVTGGGSDSECDLIVIESVPETVERKFAERRAAKLAEALTRSASASHGSEAESEEHDGSDVTEEEEVEAGDGSDGSDNVFDRERVVRFETPEHRYFEGSIRSIAACALNGLLKRDSGKGLSVHCLRVLVWFRGVSLPVDPYLVGKRQRSAYRMEARRQLVLQWDRSDSSYALGGFCEGPQDPTWGIFELSAGDLATAAARHPGRPVVHCVLSAAGTCVCVRTAHNLTFVCSS